MSVTANLTTNVETITATIVVEDESIVAEINTAARGPAGLSVINAATQSDGTADLDLLNIETVTATVSGTLTADHIHGNLAGSVYAHIRAGEALAKGDPVYVSGSHGSGSTLIPIVSKADASNAAKMPAVGIMDAAVANNANGHMVIVGTITQLNTAGYTVNAELYVASGGGFTATPPTARAQPVARVERVNANNGAVIVKVNGLSASDATGNTLVRRTSGGGAAFGALTTGPLSATAISSDTHSITSSAGTTITGPLTLSGSGSNTLSATYSNTISLTGTTGVTIAGGTLTLNSSGFAYGAGAASAHRTALGVGTTDSPTFAGLNAVGNGVTTTTLGADGRQSWFFNNSGVAAGQISYSSPGGEPGITIIRGTGRSDIRAVAGMGIAIASYSSGSGAPAEQFRFSLAGNMLVGTTSETGLTSGGLRTSGNAIIGGTLAVTGASTFGGLIEQRDGTAAQESRIYGTYTDTSNYRRLALKMSTAGVAQIVAEGLGSGAAGNRIEIDGLRIGKGGGAISTNTAVGAGALIVNSTGAEIAAFGNQSLVSNTTGGGNCAFGRNSLFLNTTASANSAFGNQSLSNNTTGGSNSAIGNSAGRFIADGTTANAVTNNSVYIGSETKALASGQTNQIVIGHSATGLGSNTATIGNSSIIETRLGGTITTYGTFTDTSNYRRLALKMSSAGVAEIVAEGAGSGSTGNVLQIEGLTIGKGGGAISTNTALGASALNANTTGTDNAAVGYQSLIANTTGSRNSASGTSSLFANTTGSDNTALGTFALFTNVSSSENTALGSRALQVSTGTSNSAVGYQSLTANTTGTSNTAIGVRSGRFIADGTTANAVTTNSVYIGAETKALASGQTNQIVIGHNATGLGSNTAVLGNDSIATTALKGNVGIGTTSPSQRLHVVGSIKASQPIIFPSYTVGTLPTGASYTGGMAYVTDEAGGATMAFYDGTNWRRVQDRAVVSVAP
jgi:hypothetical protein